VGFAFGFSMPLAATALAAVVVPFAPATFVIVFGGLPTAAATFIAMPTTATATLLLLDAKDFITFAIQLDRFAHGVNRAKKLTRDF
jgi:hypothetical protein